MKTKNIKKHVAKKTKLPSGARRFQDSTMENNTKELEAATEQQADEMERIFSNRWEW